MTTTIARLQQCIYLISANRLKLNVDKTELLWAGTRRSLSMGDNSFPSLQLGAAIIEHVQVLGVIFFGLPQPREACVQRQRDLLPPSASTTAHTVLTDLRVCHDCVSGGCVSRVEF